MSKPFFRGFLDYRPNYDLHLTEFDQEQFHQSLQLLTNALYSKGIIELYEFQTLAYCPSIAQVFDSFVVSLKTLDFSKVLGVTCRVSKQPTQDRYLVQALLLRDASSSPPLFFKQEALDLWDNLLYADTTLKCLYVGSVTLNDKVEIAATIERLRSLSRSCDTVLCQAVDARHQYRVYDYTDQHEDTPVFKPTHNSALPFSPKEQFLKMIEALKKARD